MQGKGKDSEIHSALKCSRFPLTGATEDGGCIEASAVKVRRCSM